VADLLCFRGEKVERWGPPELRLHFGLTVRVPWLGGLLPDFNIPLTWAALVDDIRSQSGGNVKAYAQYLRAGGKTFAIAAARTHEGAFDDDYNYRFTVPNARTFRWGPNLTLGAEVPWVDDPATVDADYIVLNADSIAASTVLAFGHKTGTREVTFFSDVPTAWLTSVNDVPVDDWPLKPRADWTLEERNQMRSLVRPPST